MANEFKIKKGLIVNGSGSTILDIQGSQGQLVSVTDQLSGSLFSVNDISGIPIMEVFSNNTVNLGTFAAEGLIVSGSKVIFPNLATGSTETDILVVDGQGNTVTRSDLSLQGIQGTTGATGSQGTTGATGPQGATGSAGPSNVLDASATTTSSSFFPVFVAGTGNQTPSIRTATDAFTYDPSTGRLSLGGTAGSIVTEDGNAGKPSHTFRTDETAGMFTKAGDRLGFSAGGTEIFNADVNNVNFLQRGYSFNEGIDAGNVNGEISYFGTFRESVTAGDLVTFVDAQEGEGWILADADSSNRSTQLLGITLSTVASGVSNTTGVLLRGYARYTGFPTLAIGSPIYISNTAGSLTNFIPTGSGDFVRVVGYCLNITDKLIHFCPDTTWVELA